MGISDEEVQDVLDDLQAKGLIKPSTTKNELTDLVCADLRKRGYTGPDDNWKENWGKDVKDKVVKDISDADRNPGYQGGYSRRPEPGEPVGPDMVLKELPVELQNPGNALLLADPPEKADYALEDFADLNDRSYIAKFLMRDYAGQPVDNDTFRNSEYWREAWHNNTKLQDAISKKAMSTVTSAQGSNWIPTSFSQTWANLIISESNIAGTLRQIPMPTKVTTVPVAASRSSSALVAGERVEDADVAFTASNVATASFNLTAKSIVTRVIYSGDFFEDSTPGSLDIIRNDMAAETSREIDAMCLLGDDSGTSHYQTGFHSTWAAADCRRAFDGIDYYATLGTTDNVQFSNTIAATRKGADEMYLIVAKMGKFAQNCYWVCSHPMFRRLQLIANTDGYLVNSPGGAERAAVGQPMTRFLGFPILATDLMRDDLHASTGYGVYTAASQSSSKLLCYSGDCFFLGTRRGMTLRAAEDISTNQAALVLSTRLSLGTPYTAGTDIIANAGYGMLLD